MRNEMVANYWIEEFEKMNGRKATLEEEARIRELADKVPELKPRSGEAAFGDLRTVSGGGRGLIASLQVRED
jgi:hypothetical protein